MERILSNLTKKQLKKLDKLVEQNNYSSRSEALRDALLLLLATEKSTKLKNILQKLRREAVKNNLVEPSPKELQNKIISILKKNSSGLTILEISELTNLHRHTVRKYIEILIAQEKIFQKKVGTSKLCFLKGGVKK